MRASSIAVVTVAFAIAACTKDATAPTATDPGQALMAQMSGGTHSSSASSSQNQPKFGKDDHDKNKAGHDDDDRGKCGDKVEDKDKHDGHGDDHWGKRGDDDDREECCEDDHDRGKGGHDDHDRDGHDKDGHGHHHDQDKDDDCNGGTQPPPPPPTVTGTISGADSVRDLVGKLSPASGYTVYLLNATDMSVVASQTVDAATGSYSFPYTAAAGTTYLVCEENRFRTDGTNGEFTPSSATPAPGGAVCDAAFSLPTSIYAPFGYSVTIPALGGSLGPFSFVNGSLLT